LGEKELIIGLICMDKIAQGIGVAFSMMHFDRRDIK
jgi:hypothetical protein